MANDLPDITDRLALPVGQQRAWQLLASEDCVPRWLGCLDYRGRVGHVFYMQPDAERRQAGDIEGATHCEILELDSPHRFRFSWYLPGTPKTEVSFELSAISPDETGVQFCHSGWSLFERDAIAAIHEALSGGWCGYVLPALRRLAEGAESAH